MALGQVDTKTLKCAMPVAVIRLFCFNFVGVLWLLDGFVALF